MSFIHKIRNSTGFIRLFHWEYWPFAALYWPLILHWLWQGIKAGNPFYFAASNPHIPYGGMMGESKITILNQVPDAFKAKCICVQPGTTYQEVRFLLQEAGLQLPLVTKPDIGQRGTGVRINRTEDELILSTGYYPIPYLIQEFVDYPIELGVFYVRFPGEAFGKVTSVVQKGFLQVQGDGISTIAQLIEQMPRARFQYQRLAQKTDTRRIPAQGEVVALEEVGNHCLGTTFLDANHLIDDRLHEVFNTIALQIPEFYFGRFDLRVTNTDDLYAGQDIKILELNGAGAEPGHIYQPGFSLWKAYGVLFRHSRWLYRISKANHALGVPYLSFSQARDMYRINHTALSAIIDLKTH